jgi:hypothetical protein
MNDFLKLVEESGILQKIREQIPPERLEEFDMITKQKLKEENDLYLKLSTEINKFKQDVSNARKEEPTGQSRQPDITDNE